MNGLAMFLEQMELRHCNFLTAHLHFQFSDSSSNAQKCLRVMQTIVNTVVIRHFFHLGTRMMEKIVSKAKSASQSQLCLALFLTAKEAINPQYPSYHVVHCLPESKGLLWKLQFTDEHLS